MREPDLANELVPTPPGSAMAQALGPHVRWAAWLLPAPETPEKPEHAACLVQWLLHCPGANGLWASWVASVVHLRDIPGAAPAFKIYPEAEYEVMFRAVNPEKIGPFGHPESDDPRVIADHGYMAPIDLVLQLDGINDATCTKMLNAAVEMMIRRVISPDAANHAFWAKMFATTLLHYKQGVHKEVLPV